MSELNSKSPRANYASRQAETRPNIGHPDSGLRAQDQGRAVTELADTEIAGVVTAIDATTLRADIDAAMVAQGATACNNAGARTAIAAVVTDALARTRTTQTVAPTVTLTAAR